MSDQKFKVYLSFVDESTNRFIKATDDHIKSMEKVGISIKKTGKAVGVDLNKMGESHEKAGRKARLQGRAIGELEGAIGSLRNKLLVYFFIMRPLINLTQEITKAAIIQENAEMRLASAFQATGKGALSNVESLKIYDAQLQRTTGYGDDQIIAAQGMLASFKMNEEQIRKATPALLDLNAAMKRGSGEEIELTATAKILGRALTGNVTTLERSGVTLDNTTKKYGGFDNILKAVNESVGGTANALGSTFSGKIRITNQAIGDYKESLGFIITNSPVVVSALELISSGFVDMTDEIYTASDETNNFYSIWLRIGAGLIGLFGTFKTVFMVFHAGLKGIVLLASLLATGFWNATIAAANLKLRIMELNPLMKNQAEALKEVIKKLEEYRDVSQENVNLALKNAKKSADAIANMKDDILDTYDKLEKGAERNVTARQKMIKQLQKDIADTAKDIGTMFNATETFVGTAVTGMRDTITDVLVDGVKTGFEDLGDIVSSFGDMMLKTIMQIVVNMGMIKLGMGGFLGFSGLAHTGGYISHPGVTYGSPKRKYHSGGEVDAKLLEGEYVLNRQATKNIGVSNLDKLNRGESMGGGGVNNYYIQTIDERSFRERLQAHGDLYSNASERSIRDNLSLRRTSQRFG